MTRWRVVLFRDGDEHRPPRSSQQPVAEDGGYRAESGGGAPEGRSGAEDEFVALIFFFFFFSLMLLLLMEDSFVFVKRWRRRGDEEVLELVADAGLGEGWGILRRGVEAASGEEHAEGLAPAQVDDRAGCWTAGGAAGDGALGGEKLEFVH